MVTEVIHNIKTDCTGDPLCYTTLTAWEAAQQRDLVAADGGAGEIAVAECYIGSIVDAVNIAGWTANATCYPLIRAAAGQGHGGIPGAGFKITSTSASTAITVGVTHCRVIGIEISATSTGAPIGSNTPNTGEMWVQGCIINDSANHGISIAHPATSYVNNNIIFGHATNGIRLNLTGTMHCYNNTVIGGTIGINRVAGTLRPKNNIVQASTTCFSGTMTNNETNISSDATSPETGLRNITLDFINAGANNYHLAATDTEAIDAGTDLSADANLPFSIDIDGATRIAPWDIGADQTVAAEAPEYEQVSYQFFSNTGTGLGPPP